MARSATRGPESEVTAWRLIKTRYAASAFDGEGARLHGARWSSPGVRVAYAAESTALAVLEVLVYLRASGVLSSYSFAEVRFPEASVMKVRTEALPSGWAESPAPASVQRVGDDWVREARSVVLRVPSVVLAGAFNYLLNPLHPDFPRVLVGPTRPFAFDPRLLR